MPRTVDHIVATHQHVAALRAQGKPVWAHHVDIRSAIESHEGEDVTLEQLVALAHQVAQTLRAKLPASYFDIENDDSDFSFNDAVEELESLSVRGLEQDRDDGHEPLEIVDGWLDEIYDWADRNRVWLGA